MTENKYHKNKIFINDAESINNKCKSCKKKIDKKYFYCYKCNIENNNFREEIKNNKAKYWKQCKTVKCENRILKKYSICYSCKDDKSDNKNNSTNVIMPKKGI
tara:strand:+ start:567 stop:875 length:309 start_codon:yes stop_codon:yes gene_type:complete